MIRSKAGLDLKSSTISDKSPGSKKAMFAVEKISSA